MGPTLWNIINDLIALLASAPNSQIVVFADDITIMIQGPSILDILATFQNTLKTIEDWCRKHRLTISKDKSALTYIRNREQYERHPAVVAGGISVVSKM